MRNLLSRMVLVLLLAGLSVVGLPVIPTAHAATDECAAPGYRTDVRPDPKGPPTEVNLGVRVVDLLEINDVNQTITLDMALQFNWNDPRLAHLEGCELPVSQVWHPQLVLENSGRMFERWPENVSILENGGVQYFQRVSGTFSSHHKLQNFPFDKQIIALEFYPLKWTAQKVVLKDIPLFSGISDNLNISDWQVTGAEVVLSEVEIEALGKVHSAYALEISAQRYLSYYIWKIILPIALIVAMSWCVFWLDASHFGTQVGLSATSVLTMVAFIFATTNMLPRLGYFTMLDLYIAGATVMVFLALTQSLTTGYLVYRQKAYLAQRIDQVSRFVFPLIFGLFGLRIYLKAIEVI